MARYSVVLNREDDAWVAIVPALEGVATQGDSVEHALEMAHDLIKLVIRGYERNGEPVPVEVEPVQLHTLDVDACERSDAQVGIN
jgi:predicted RNase H-like HicB family nuclease